MPKKKTHEDFLEEVKPFEDIIEVLEEYKNSTTEILFLHKECNKQFYITPKRLFKKLQHKKFHCTECSPLKKKTHEQFLKEVYDLVGDEYTVLGKYVNNHTSIEFLHNVCGHIYNVKPYNFKMGHGCPKCSGLMKKPLTSFKLEVFQTVANEYSVLSEHLVNTQTKIKMRHNNKDCGYYEYEVTPNKFLQGKRCPKCFKNWRKTTEEFKAEVFDLEGSEYIVLGDYLNGKTKIKIQHSHSRCDNHIYEVTPNDFLRGYRCPVCSESKGETKIRKKLSSLKLPFKMQYKFDDCRNKNPLPFDFAVFNNDNSLRCLIEYDGEQHFRPMRFGSSKEKNIMKYEQTVKNDKIKDTYCENNSIKLIRISYKNYEQVETILEELLM